MKAPHIPFQHVVSQPIDSHSVQPKFTASFPLAWQRFWEWLLALDSQIQVTQKHDRSGNEYYQIYNRCSGQIKTFSSQQDAIIWLDRERF